MSWISDVKYEMGKLDFSVKSLKKFGFTIGIIFSLVFVWTFVNESFEIIRTILIIFGTFLILMAIIAPKLLANVYKIWMGLALILGWFVSRFVLSVLFVFILTPISLIAKIVGKRFLDTSFKSGKNSYWIKKEDIQSNYEKMY